ncbi:MAG: penicillin-binding protein 2 [Kiloniellales bacterium]|nr:penicillin-binding protein 2 [Kiloniellales bacterium]
MSRRIPSPRRPRRPRAAEREVAPVDLVLLDGTTSQALEAGRTRLIAVGLLFCLAFGVIGLRVVDLALLRDGNEPRLAAEAGRKTLVTDRADIVDRNGIVLATSLPTASLYANPRQVRDPEGTAAALASILADVNPVVLAGKLRSDRSFVWLKRNLSPREHYEVNRLGVPGLDFKREEQRVYPHGELLTHVLGLVDVDNKGIAGLEKRFNGRLRGAAEPLSLSIDLRLQHILSEELHGAMTAFEAIGAAGMILDAESGEVLAMSSLPTFEPEQAGKANEEARFNRAALGVYEMGSVFKIFTTALALESGTVTLADGFDTSKPIRVARHTIRDYKPKNRWLSIPEIFVYSSNIGTVHMAMETGTEAQQGFLDSLGLMTPAAIELPEVGAPMLPSPWREINTMTISFGHGMAVSPVQLTSAVASVVNGGELRPATLLKRPAGAPEGGRRVLSTATSQKMRWLMRQVVLQGTGGKAAAPGYLVGGKTGTADKLRDGRYSRGSRIASFVGAFPMHAPRYVIFAMVDEPKGQKESYGYATGGWVAAPAVGRVVERIAPLVGIKPLPVRSEEEGETTDLMVQASAEGFAFAFE